MRHRSLVARSVLGIAIPMVLAAGAVPTMVTYGQPTVRHNRATQLASLLDEDKAVFGGFVNFAGVGNAPLDAMTHSRDSSIDVVMYDLEHSPFDVTQLRTYMQFLLDPGAIAEAGEVKATKTVIARIPAYGRELTANTWMVKNVLDAGVHGVVFPHIESAEQAMTAVGARRYPQEPGARDVDPIGIRGSGAMVAARYWGLSVPDYMEQSDIWRLDPNGNLVPWFIIENKLGVANVRDIARALDTGNVGAVLWAGTGDLAASYNNDQAAVAKAVDAILAAGKEFGLPVALNGSANLTQRMEQGARIFMGGASAAARREAGR